MPQMSGKYSALPVGTHRETGDLAKSTLCCPFSD
jgi:hypothetical protein